MPKLVSALAALLFATFPADLAYAQSGVVLFGGYSYVHSPVTVEEDISSTCTPPVCNSNVVRPPTKEFVTPHQSLNGWEVSATYRFLPWLGAAADFSGHYGTAVSPSNVHQYTYLFGPEVSLPGRVAPFAHVLLGVAHESVSAVPVGALPLPVGEVESIPGRTSSSFATALGGGIDLKLSRHFWIRAVQVDYLLTRFGSVTQNQPQISAGLAVHF